MTHYALSELLIVVAGAWAIRRALAQQHISVAFGIFLFSAAAAIGVIRFGFDRDGSLIAALADIHRLAGTLGGTAAMMALVYHLLARRVSGASATQSLMRRYMFVSAAALAFAIAFPRLLVPLFALWSVAFIILATRRAALLKRPPVQVLFISAFMLFNVLVFRQAAWLSPAMSWHIFHILTALWLVGLGFLLARPPAPNAASRA
jgi:hypothetical protein